MYGYRQPVWWRQSRRPLQCGRERAARPRPRQRGRDVAQLLVVLLVLLLEQRRADAHTTWKLYKLRGDMTLNRLNDLRKKYYLFYVHHSRTVWSKIVTTPSLELSWTLNLLTIST